jgi:hypothetical protein
MRLQQIQTSYLTENLDYDHIRLVRLWESTGLKLKEAALTADQIQSLFAEIEKGATEAGSNRTALGKGKDAVTAVNKAWEDLKTKMQNSGPIKGFDQKVSDALSKVGMGAADPEFNGQVNKWVQKYRDFAKKHPVAQGAIYATLIALAGITGAGVGGAAALGLLKMADKLLQGEKFSSAAYSGVKAGAMAFAASKLGDYIKGMKAGDQVPPAEVSELPPDAPKMDFEKYDYYVGDSNNVVAVPKGGPNPFTDDAAFDAMDQAKELRAALRAPDGAVDAAGSAASGAGEVVKGSGAEMFKGLASDSMADATIKRIADSIAAGQLSTSDLQHLQASQGFIANALSNADPAKEAALTAHYNLLDKMLRAANEIPVNSSIIRTGKALSEGQVYMIFNRVCARNDQMLSEGKLIEGPLDAIKGLAGKAAGAVAGKAKQIGTNLTTKVTADKLNSAWKKAGSPMDSEELKAFLGKQGVSTEVIGNVYKTLKIPAAAAPGTVDIEQVKQMIASLPVDRKARLLKYLTKQPEQQAAPAATAQSAA